MKFELFILKFEKVPKSSKNDKVRESSNNIERQTSSVRILTRRPFNVGVIEADFCDSSSRRILQCTLTT